MDLTGYNRITNGPSRVQLLTANELLEKIKDSYCSSIDLFHCYFSIKLSKSSRDLINVYWLNGTLLSLQRLPQGWKSSLFFAELALRLTFNPRMIKTFRHKYNIPIHTFPYTHPDEIVSRYVDDIMISSKKDKGEDHHILCCKFVLYCLETVGFKIKLKKCAFFSSNLTFLGRYYDLNNNTHKIHPNKLKAFTNYRVPRSPAELASRLASLNYERVYAILAKVIAAPLYSLIKKDDFHWTLVHSRAWFDLLFLYSMALELVFISPSDHLVLSTDASNNAIGYGAFKFDPNTFQLQLAMTDSKLLNQADRNKSTITKEVISLLYCLHSMEYQIRQSEHEVILLSDAQSISQIQRFRNTSDYYLQIALFLASLNKVKILFIPGTANLLADSLSRRMADSLIKKRKLNQPRIS